MFPQKNLARKGLIPFSIAIFLRFSIFHMQHINIMRLLKSKKHYMYDFLNVFVSLETVQVMNTV